MRSPERLPALSRGWRAAVTILSAGTLLLGGLTLSNDLFPFGVLDQFSRGTDPDGEVVNTCLLGEQPDGRRIDIPFGERSVGVGRADVENQIPAIEQDPSLLEPLAAAYESRHPDEPPLESMILCRRITQLRDGTAHGEEELVEVVRWERP